MSNNIKNNINTANNPSDINEDINFDIEDIHTNDNQTTSNIKSQNHKITNTEDKDTKDTYSITPSKKYGINVKGVILGALSIIVGAVGINIFMSKASNTSQAQTTNIPDTDKSKLAVVDAQEKANRDKVNLQQAEQALQNGQTMQGEIYLQNSNPNLAQPQIALVQPAQMQAQAFPTQAVQNIQPMQALPANPPMTPEEKELDLKIKENILKQAQGIIGTQHSGYSSMNYARTINKNNINQINNQDTQDNSKSSKTAKKLIFKAGDILYATLITGVNTDDSNNVIATVYGGAYDQATLIGQINVQPNNINIQFNQLSPKDRTKKSIAIQAIAIREQDAKQGVAEGIDNHTFERYSYLFAASMLKAVGKAAEGATQTTVGLGGAIVQTQEKVTEPREIAKQGLGEVGTTMGNEVRRKFNRPPTYTIPANQGIGIIFMKDTEDSQ
jgi:intracellular multiplication protein IcmE